MLVAVEKKDNGIQLGVQSTLYRQDPSHCASHARHE